RRRRPWGAGVGKLAGDLGGGRGSCWETPGRVQRVRICGVGLGRVAGRLAGPSCGSAAARGEGRLGNRQRVPRYRRRLFDL
ncbi:MAG: hypothetical protein WC718_16805, partial [Phycisphaerales bacterium]